MTEEKREEADARAWLDVVCRAIPPCDLNSMMAKEHMAAAVVLRDQARDATLRQQLEAERHGAWAAGHRAGWKDRFGSDCAFDQGYDPDEPTPNPYPPPPAEAPVLPVGKETE